MRALKHPFCDACTRRRRHVSSRLREQRKATRRALASPAEPAWWSAVTAIPTDLALLHCAVESNHEVVAGGMFRWRQRFGDRFDFVLTLERDC